VFDHGFALGVLAGQVAAQTTEFCFAGFILYVEKKRDVAALEKGVGLGLYAGCEHSEGVFVDETAKDAEVCFGVGGADIHGFDVEYMSLYYWNDFWANKDICNLEVFKLE
jgi:hypothetical protein